MNNNIDKILRRELKYKYLNKVENGLAEYNLTFRALNNYVRCGRRPAFLKPDKVFVDRFGDVKPPEHKSVCLCGVRLGFVVQMNMCVSLVVCDLKVRSLADWE